jgi:hypothetical protein
MGADRLKDQKDQAKRGWNKAGMRLTEPEQLSLFNADSVLASRSFRIVLRKKIETDVGDEFLLHGEGQILTRGPEIIGECASVPASVLDELKIGGAICVEVIGVGVIGNSLEVAQK